MTDQPSFDDLCLDMLRQMGGRGTAEDVAKHVAPSLTRERYELATWKGFVSQIRSSLRRSGESGLPEAPFVGGQYVQQSLLTVDEYRALVTSHMQAAGRSRNRAQQYAQQCEAIYEVHIDLDASVSA